MRYGSRKRRGAVTGAVAAAAAMAADGERSPLLPAESGDGGGLGSVGPASLASGPASIAPGKPNPPQGEPPFLIYIHGRPLEKGKWAGTRRGRWTRGDPERRGRQVRRRGLCMGAWLGRGVKLEWVSIIRTALHLKSFWGGVVVFFFCCITVISLL